jgi:hypothetical protein
MTETTTYEITVMANAVVYETWRLQLPADLTPGEVADAFHAGEGELTFISQEVTDEENRQVTGVDRIDGPARIEV